MATASAADCLPEEVPEPVPAARAPPLRLLLSSEIEQRILDLFREFCVERRAEPFRKLFEFAGPLLLPLVRMKLRRRRCDPAEVLTDAFVQVYRHHETFQDRGPGSFARWFLRIAENLVRQDARQAARRSKREQLVARHVSDHDADPYLHAVKGEARLIARVSYGEVRRLVIEAMHRLPAKYEQVLLLHSQERLTYGAIAQRLQITRAAVGMRLRRARDRIVAQIEHGLTPIARVMEENR